VLLRAGNSEFFLHPKVDSPKCANKKQGGCDLPAMVILTILLICFDFLNHSFCGSHTAIGQFDCIMKGIVRIHFCEITQSDMNECQHIDEWLCLLLEFVSSHIVAQRHKIRPDTIDKSDEFTQFDNRDVGGFVGHVRIIQVRDKRVKHQVTRIFFVKGLDGQDGSWYNPLMLTKVQQKARFDRLSTSDDQETVHLPFPERLLKTREWLMQQDHNDLDWKQTIASIESLLTEMGVSYE